MAKTVSKTGKIEAKALYFTGRSAMWKEVAPERPRKKR
jgi:hypothetical protein